MSEWCIMADSLRADSELPCPYSLEGIKQFVIRC